MCVGSEWRDIQYLVSPALGLAVTVIKFLQRHFGVDKAYAGLELVFDSFDVLVGKDRTGSPHIWSISSSFQKERSTIINTSFF